VLKVRTGLAIGLLAQLAVLIALAATVMLGPLGWLVGTSCGVITNLLLARGLLRAGAVGMGPADRVTLTRATLVGGIAALIADSLSGPISVPTLVSLAAVALFLDAVDGWVARRTGTVSSLGARFDMEVDAFLILILSIYVVRLTGDWWVLTIGAARYFFVAAGWLQPWMRGALPPRYWRKVVAATQGIVLTIVAADVLPGWLSTTALAMSLALLAESFGRDVWWLWAHRARTTADVGSPVVTEPVVDTADHGPAGSAMGDTAASSPRHRAEHRSSRIPDSAIPSAIRGVAAGLVTVLGCLSLWFALLGPDDIHHLTPVAFLRLPVEGLVIVAIALMLPAGARRVFAVVVGVVLGLLTLVKFFDMGFYAAFDRPFNPVTDWSYADSAFGVLGDSIGRTGAIAAVVGAVVIALAVLIGMPLALLRLSRLAAEHRRMSQRSVAVLGAAWVAFAVLGAQIGQGAPLASASAAGLTVDQLQQVRAGIADQEEFAAAVADDPFAADPTPPAAVATSGTAAVEAPTEPDAAVGAPLVGVAAASPLAAVATTPEPIPSPAVPTTTAAEAVPGSELLTALRGKDVIIAFVESYGRVAFQDPSMSTQIAGTLDAGTEHLTQSGFAARSAFLTSSAFGGGSWLAHATLQSGLWIDSQQRYDQLVASDRLTLSGAFKRAGWRTVGDVPSNEKEWPEGSSFYHYDQIYDARNVGYTGPAFSYASMPDQYILHAFQRLELAPPDRGPVMAEIDLVSSHAPWAPLPRTVEWNAVGDGSIFDGMPEEGQDPNVVLANSKLTKAAYAESIQYSVNTLVSFVQNYGNDNLVLIMLGDHQPATNVTGESPSHDVPISIIAHDPTVLDRISGWNWQAGLRPDPQAPVWPMDAFRDRFLTAYGP
jgi:phosphatidylglycerophosphate synthase